MTEEAWLAQISTQVPRVPWDVFIGDWRWEQGEHVGLIGPTGSGKTTLLGAILPYRSYVVVFGTKPADDTLDMLLEQEHYRKFTEWLRVPAHKSPRRVLWPDASEIDAEENQKIVFGNAFRAIFKEQNWCVVVDEGWYVSEMLRLKQQMRVYWTQGRSLGLSFVVCTQRPAWVPVEMYDGSTHLFFWRTTEEEALRRMSSLGAANNAIVRYIVPRLEEHQTLYINTRTGAMRRTRAPWPIRPSQPPKEPPESEETPQ
jgi:hypothetical protein